MNPQPIVCARCAVWRGEPDATFQPGKDAAEHLITVHPARAINLLASLCVDQEHVRDALESKEHLT